MTGFKGRLIIISLLFLLALAGSASAQNLTALEQLQTQLQGVQKDLTQKMNSFDTDGSESRFENVSEGGINYTVRVYTDQNGTILRVKSFETLENGMMVEKVVEKKIISPEEGPVLTVTYNPDGSVEQTVTFEPIGLKTYTEVNNPDGTKTEIVEDASVGSNNTLTTKLDSSGKILTQEISTSPGLPEGCTYCKNTGQYECKKAA